METILFFNKTAVTVAITTQTLKGLRTEPLPVIVARLSVRRSNGSPEVDGKA